MFPKYQEKNKDLSSFKRTKLLNFNSSAISQTLWIHVFIFNQSLISILFPKSIFIFIFIFCFLQFSDTKPNRVTLGVFLGSWRFSLWLTSAMIFLQTFLTAKYSRYQCILPPDLRPNCQHLWEAVLNHLFSLCDIKYENRLIIKVFFARSVSNNKGYQL